MVLLYRVFLVALGLLVSGSSSESCEDEQCMSFMQMKLETHHHLDGQAKSAAQGVPGYGIFLRHTAVSGIIC